MHVFQKKYSFFINSDRNIFKNKNPIQLPSLPIPYCVICILRSIHVLRIHGYLVLNIFLSLLIKNCIFFLKNMRNIIKFQMN